MQVGLFFRRAQTIRTFLAAVSEVPGNRFLTDGIRQASRSRRTLHLTFTNVFRFLGVQSPKCVDTAIPSCYFSTAARFFVPTLIAEARHTGTMAFVAMK